MHTHANIYYTREYLATNYRALLQKMTYKHKASCGSSPPYVMKIALASICVYARLWDQQTHKR